MANRYWVGGTGTWNTTSTTNWSDTSGGGGGKSVPTAADSVFFDQGGTYTVSMGTGLNCLDLLVSAGAVTFGIGGSLTCYGSFTLRAGGSWGVGAQTSVTFAATTTGKTITTNGVLMTASVITMNGVGGGWTLGSAWSIGYITWTNGTFSTNNFNLTISRTEGFLTGVGTKTLNWGSSTIASTALGAPSATLVNFGLTFDAGLTLNAGTSSLTSVSTAVSFIATNLTFYNVTINTTTNFMDSGSFIRGANTFNNLTITTASTTPLAVLSVFNNIVVNGTFSTGVNLSASNGGALLQIRASTRGTPVTITAAATSLLCTTFQDITAAGAAAPFTGTNVGNGGGCSNITFTAAKTVYWNLAAGGQFTPSSTGSTAWATTSGGVPSRANYPLPQDTAIIENTGLTTGSTITFGLALMCNILCTRTNSWNIAGTAFSAFGDITLTSIGTIGSFASISVNSSLGLKTFTFNGFLSGVTLSLSGSSSTGVRFGSAMSNPISIATQGVVDLNGYTWSPTVVNLVPTAASTFTANGGNVTVASNNRTVFTSNTNMTYTTATTFNFTYSGSVGTRNFTGPTVASLTNSGNININITGGTDIVRLQAASGGYSYGAVNFTGFSGTYAGSGAGSNNFKSVVFSSSMTLNTISNYQISFYGTGTITTNGKLIPYSVSIGVSQVPQLTAATTLTGAYTSSNQLQMLDGTFNTANFSVSASSFVDSGSAVKTVNFGSSTVTVTGSTFRLDSLNTAVNATASTISMTSSSLKVFTGGGFAYGTLNQGGTGAVNISYNNSFANITNTAGAATTIAFSPGSTTTLANFSANGTAGNLLTITVHTTAAQYTLAYTGSTPLSKSFCSFSQANGTPNTMWQAYIANGNVDAGNNTGILFNPPTGFFMFMAA